MSITILRLRKPHYRLFILIIFWLLTFSVNADPEQDLARFRQYYKERFPQLELADYRNGIYAIDPIARQSWAAIEEFPPYETAIEAGKKLFDTAIANGKYYADCFSASSKGIANRYPQWDRTRQEVLTLAMAINACRRKSNAQPLAYEKGDMVNLLAYLAYISRGKVIDVRIPENEPRALAAYEKGKAFYSQRHGQLNFACATCHIQNVGKRLRSELLTPSLGHTSNWPVYRLKWGETGTLHRRFAECLTQIRAKPYAEQSIEFRNLEYFLAYMSNGVPISGPSVRK